MGTVDNKQGNYKNKDELSLKEIINILVNNVKLIAGITVSFLVIAILYLSLVAKPVYESSISGYINIANAISEFGEFPFPSEQPADYLRALNSCDVLDLAVQNGAEMEAKEAFAKSISIVQDKDEKSKAFTINVRANTPEKAQKNAEILAASFLKVQERMLERNAVGYYQNVLGSQLYELEQCKSYIENDIAAIEADLKEKGAVITLQKLAVTDPAYSGIIGDKRDLSASGKDALLEEEIDPVYIGMADKLVEKKSSLYDIESDIEKHKWQLEELAYLSSQLESKGINEPILRNNGLSFKIITTQIVLNNSASLPEKTVSPHKAVILILAVVFGVLIGVFIVFFKVYWEKAN